MKTSTNTPRRSYGNGFESLPYRKEMRDFVAWWNDRSQFPVSDAGDAK